MCTFVKWLWPSRQQGLTLMKNILTTFQKVENVFLVSVSITVRTLPQLVTQEPLKVGTSWEHETWCGAASFVQALFEPSLCCPVCSQPSSQQWPTSTSFIHFKSVVVPFCMFKRWRLQFAVRMNNLTFSFVFQIKPLYPFFAFHQRLAAC